MLLGVQAAIFPAAGALQHQEAQGAAQAAENGREGPYCSRQVFGEFLRMALYLRKVQVTVVYRKSRLAKMGCNVTQASSPRHGEVARIVQLLEEALLVNLIPMPRSSA